MASSSSVFTVQEYDVFLSFKGPDTRNTITSRLYASLVQNNIKTFFDNEALQRGDGISRAFEEAIERSKLAIVVFSEEYASSSWCLEELVHILKCRERNHQMVVPVFYHVRPSHVRHQIGSFAAGFAKHEVCFEIGKVKGWRDALSEAASLSGWDAQDIRPESELVKKMVEDISKKLNNNPLNNELKRFRRSINNWQKGELLGRGSFGSVYKGISDDGYFFAVKEVSLLDQGDQGRQSIIQLEQEIALLSQFEHENIVKYLGTDKDESTVYIFLELVTMGSLRKLYQSYNLQDSQVSNYTRQILYGLKYLHHQAIVHRDIKCANILVHANGSVKLADFGLAKVIEFSVANSFKGTAYWMAPEVVNNSGSGYGFPADIWSLGCTVLEMLTRKIPYQGMEWQQALYHIGQGRPPTVPDTLSNDARDFILKCIQVDPSARLTAAQLLDHQFVNRRH